MPLRFDPAPGAVLQAAQDGTAGPYAATANDTRRFTLWARQHHARTGADARQAPADAEDAIERGEQLAINVAALALGDCTKEGRP